MLSLFVSGQWSVATENGQVTTDKKPRFINEVINRT